MRTKNKVSAYGGEGGWSDESEEDGCLSSRLWVSAPHGRQRIPVSPKWMGVAVARPLVHALHSLLGGYLCGFPALQCLEHRFTPPQALGQQEIGVVLAEIVLGSIVRHGLLILGPCI